LMLRVQTKTCSRKSSAPQHRIHATENVPKDSRSPLE
jgi:hypothetical protein